MPVMAQVDGFKLSPAGKAGLTVQFVTVPVKAGAILTETPTVKIALFVPVEPVVKTKLEGAVSVAVVEVLVFVEELPPNNAIGKSAVSGDCPFLPLQLTSKRVKTKIILNL